MRFIIIVVIVTGFFAIYMSKPVEVKSNNLRLSMQKKCPLNLSR